MFGQNVDAFLVSNYYNILYLSGFKGLSKDEREAWLVMTKKNSYFLTDDRYDFIPKGFIRKTISMQKRASDHLLDIINEEDIKTLGFESEDLKVFEYEQFSKKLTTSLVSTRNVLMEKRAIKSAEEISRIEKACIAADKCFSDIIPRIKPGLSERRIAEMIVSWTAEKNLDYAFYPIVATDENAAIPHYDTKTSGIKTVGKQSTILIDFGVTYENYHSDMTRMIFVGTPSTEIMDTYNAVLLAQEAGIKLSKNKQTIKEIDETCRNAITYRHATGHGIGLEVHELPKISIVSEGSLIENEVITIEPGYYIPGKFGIRIEDTVLVEHDRGRSLTKTSKQPVIL